jgi:hypothetical protein
MLLISVALVELHEIGPVETLLNLRTNVPPEIEPAKVSVWTSLVPALGAVAVLYTLPCGGITVPACNGSNIRIDVATIAQLLMAERVSRFTLMGWYWSKNFLSS